MKLNLPLTKQILTQFVREETEKIGLKTVVLGLSGGIDSALSAAIAAEALGPENVFAVALPYKLSSGESLADARLVADAFGLNFEVADITPYAEPYMDANPDMDKMRIGNVLARMRMVTLFDRSAKHRGIVLGTSNKTELLLGYGTWYGDLASAINPIGDLYKTQVWELSEYLNIPERVITKKPTADLWPDQTDESELGFSYRDVDKLLYEMVDKRNRKRDLLEEGFEESFIDKVTERIRRNQFKRKIPVIAKVSQRTIGRDFRYSRDWGY
ncbi:NAD+ synthase [Limisalsivibrio acetivorans]|uniref:NAD+ synthase n=1 Tax=Limisalsivibrio acetivorans TaxID=1304888 RepID=UPI0003B54604|nr:NAD+ synthase [Limisalsivibrio acetivorans]